MNTKNIEVVNISRLQNKGAAKRSLLVSSSSSPEIINVAVLKGKKHN